MENKRPLVCIHGFLESKSMWEQLSLEQLERPLFFLEIPGHGARKNEAPRAYGIGELAQDFNTALAREGIAAYDLLGHSMGGYIALEMAALPGFNGKVVLLNSTYKADTEAKKQDRLRVSKIVLHDKRHFVREAIPSLFAEPEAHDAIVRSMIEEAAAMQGEWIAQAALAMRARRDHRGIVTALGSRCTFILGEHDRAVPPGTILEERAFFPGAELHVLRDSGHMSYIECPEEVMGILAASGE